MYVYMLKESKNNYQEKGKNSGTSKLAEFIPPKKREREKTQIIEMRN